MKMSEEKKIFFFHDSRKKKETKLKKLLTMKTSENFAAVAIKNTNIKYF